MSELLTTRFQHMHTTAESEFHVLPQHENTTSTTIATYDMPQNILTSTVPEDDMPYIEYSMVIEPESMVVFEEKEYQQVQVLCSDSNEDMEKICISSCAQQALVVRKKRYKRASVFTSTLYCKQKC